MAHNIVINEDTGYAYIVGAAGIGCQGLYMVDLSEPLNPQYAGCHMESSPVRSNTHDAQCVIYSGPDADYTGREICMLSNENYVAIADVTDKNNTISISHVNYPAARYVHQGWLTPDQKYFIQNDELDEQLSFDIKNTRTLIWDVEDLDDPILLKEYLAVGTSIDHNLYIKGEYVYQSNYTDGLHVLDVSDPENPWEIGFFDMHNRTPNDPGFDAFDGAFSNYPYFESGAIAVSSWEEGLIMVRFNPSNDDEVPEAPEGRVISVEAFPNPFSDNLTLTLTLTSSQFVGIALFDVLGRAVITIASGNLAANQEYQFQIDSSGMAPGTYFYNITGETFELSEPISRVK